MPTIVIQPKDLARALKREGQRVPNAAKAAAYAAAQRLRARIMEEIDKRKITDMGILKNSIRVVKQNRDAQGRFLPGGSVAVRADAPHAGIVELGARPHPVSPEGRMAIARWAARKLGLSDKEAERASWAIAQKIRERGQPPTYVFASCVPDGLKFFGEEIVRILNSRSAA
jgi:hypothetical protein